MGYGSGVNRHEQMFDGPSEKWLDNTNAVFNTTTNEEKTLLHFHPLTFKYRRQMIPSPPLYYVHIESSTACDAKCKMCPHGRLRRKGTMKYELFTSIVDQAVDLGCQTFTLFRVGEPLLFPDLFKWMDYIREKKARVSIYTNGSNLTKEIGDRLNEYKDIFCDLSFSFHGNDKESYEAMMGLDFDRTYNRIRDFLTDNPIPANIYSLSNDVYDAEYTAKFKALWEGFPSLATDVARFMEWAGSVEGFKTLIDEAEARGYKLRRVPCMRILNEIDVMIDGRVCLCCVDAFGDILFGNLNELSLTEVLEHPLRKYYQEKHLENKADELPLCKYCSTSMEII